MKPLIFVLSITLLALQYKLWFGDSSVPAIMLLKEQLAEQVASDDKARLINQELEAEIGELKNGSDAVEERARFELGMVKQNETYYHIID